MAVPATIVDTSHQLQLLRSELKTLTDLVRGGEQRYSVGLSKLFAPASDDTRQAKELEALKVQMKKKEAEWAKERTKQLLSKASLVTLAHQKSELEADLQKANEDVKKMKILQSKLVKANERYEIAKINLAALDNDVKDAKLQAIEALKKSKTLMAERKVLVQQRQQCEQLYQQQMEKVSELEKILKTQQQTNRKMAELEHENEVLRLKLKETKKQHKRKAAQKKLELLHEDAKALKTLTPRKRARRSIYNAIEFN